MARLTRSFWTTFVKSKGYLRHASVSIHISIANYYSYMFIVDTLNDIIKKVERNGAPIRAVTPCAVISVSFESKLFGVFSATKILRNMVKFYSKKAYAMRKQKNFPLKKQREQFLVYIKAIHGAMAKNLKATNSVAKPAEKLS